MAEHSNSGGTADMTVRPEQLGQIVSGRAVFFIATVEKDHFPPVLAQRWENDFETRTDMSIKAERSNAICEYSEDCGRAKRGAIRKLQ